MKYGDSKMNEIRENIQKNNLLYNTKYISDNTEIFRFLRLRKTPPRDDIKPKKLNFRETANVKFFEESGNNNNLFFNDNNNSLRKDGYNSGKYKFFIQKILLDYF